ncbi:MAG: hypothetical protein WCJ35_17530 [Planctomycetota bacterium]
MGQPSHWTYRSFVATDDLQQGDIVRRSPSLLEVLSEVLSHFCDERYTAFLVVTQSCDLVTRNENVCKADYINLCVIRELEPLLPTLLEPCCGAGIPGIFDSERRLYAEQLLKRVVNQNEQAQGLFYLHPDADVGIPTASVALLRVSIALRRDHYRMLQECRCGQLEPEYAAKLGWLTGNLYSRIATPDWEEQEKDESASAKQAQSLLRRISRPSDQNWVPARWLKAAREKNVDLSNIPVELFRSTLAEHAPPDLHDVVLEAIQRVGRGVVANDPCAAVSAKLAGHGDFVREVAKHMVACLGNSLSTDEQKTLMESLTADGNFSKAIGDQVASLLKVQSVAIGKEAVNMIANFLTATTGVLMPASNRLRTALSSLLKAERVGEVDELVESVAKKCAFSPAAAAIVAAEAQAIFGQIDFGLLDKLIFRLKNDQKLRAASREQAGE